MCHCVATSHTLNMSEVATAEFQLGKLATRVEMLSIRDMVRACTDLEYINPTCSSNAVGPPHEINKYFLIFIGSLYKYFVYNTICAKHCEKTVTPR